MLAMLRVLQTPQRAVFQCQTPLGEVLHLRANNLIFIINPQKEATENKSYLDKGACLNILVKNHEPSGLIEKG